MDGLLSAVLVVVVVVVVVCVLAEIVARTARADDGVITAAALVAREVDEADAARGQRVVDGGRGWRR